MKRVLFLLLISGAMAYSQPTDTTAKQFGAYLGYVQPSGKFSDYPSGATLGLCYSIPFDGPDRLQFKLDFTGMSPGTRYKPYYFHAGLFAEYIAYVAPSFYSFAGIGVLAQELNDSYVFYYGNDIKIPAERVTGYAGVAGVGYDLISKKSFMLSSEIRGTLGISGFDYASFQFVIVGRLNL